MAKIDSSDAQSQWPECTVYSCARRNGLNPDDRPLNVAQEKRGTGMGCGASSSSQTRAAEGCQAWGDDDGLRGDDGLRACAVTPPLVPTRSNRLRLSRPAALDAHSAARRQVQLQDDEPILATELTEAEVLWLQQEELR